jgi:hypothetical protein
MNDREKSNVNARLNHGLECLLAAVGNLYQLYTEHPELDDMYDMSKVFPMSLDEWSEEIGRKISHISYHK